MVATSKWNPNGPQHPLGWQGGHTWSGTPAALPERTFDAWEMRLLLALGRLAGDSVLVGSLVGAHSARGRGVWKS